MSATYAKYSGLGGGGSATGDVVGPASSVQFSVPVFADTTGKLLEDSQTSKTMLVPIGDTTDGGGLLGIQFHGTGSDGPATNGTGFKVLTQTGQEFLQHLLDGKQVFASSATVGQDRTHVALTFLGKTIRPDAAYDDITVGNKSNAFSAMYATGFLGGDTSSTSPTGRRLLIGSSNNNPAGALNQAAMGFDNSNSNEFYWNMFDGTGGPQTWRDAFNVTLSGSKMVTLSAPADDGSVWTTQNALSFTLKGQSKAGGSSGNGGDVVVQPGSSSVGDPGHFFIPSEAGAPTTTPAARTGFIAMQFDSTNNKLYAYLNGAWKAVLLV